MPFHVCMCAVVKVVTVTGIGRYCCQYADQTQVMATLSEHEEYEGTYLPTIHDMMTVSTTLT